MNLRYIVLFALALTVEPVCGDPQSKGDYGVKKGSRNSGTTTNPYPTPAPPTTNPYPTPAPANTPINKYCFTELAAIWWSWYLCYYSDFTVAKNSCPVQDARIPANTTFLFYDIAQNCSNYTINKRTCDIPANHWIILPVAGSSTLTDFVSPGNTLDTPEGIKMSTNLAVDAFTQFTAKIDGKVVAAPRYESQDLCSLETVDVGGCTGLGPFVSVDGWSIFSVAYWLRIDPLPAGTHTIEVSNIGPSGCAGTNYTINVAA
jgi:hypothetical protein